LKRVYLIQKWVWISATGRCHGAKLVPFSEGFVLVYGVTRSNEQLVSPKQFLYS